jgi:microcin C transport system permease protein
MKNKNQQSSQKPLTVNQRRWRKFKTLRRGYYSLVILSICYIISFFLPLIINNRALIVHYKGETYFPAFRDLMDVPGLKLLTSPPFISGVSLGQIGNEGECNYRQLQEQYEQDAGSENYVIMPMYPYGPLEDITAGNPAFAAPLEDKDGASGRIFGTDDRGRDVFARMLYGFQVSITFALILTIIEFLIGIPIGAAMGYWGGKFDILMQRFMEIWGTLPGLFLIIILVALLNPTSTIFQFTLLLVLSAIFAWLGPASQMRAQFYRERSRDYVAAAISIGVPTHKILFKHILPNSLVPIVTSLPFAVVSGITSLLSLDFLGFGLMPPTPSWGQMVSVGLANLTNGYWWLILVPLSAMFLTLIAVVFIGEAIREAFDPKVFSRLR